MMRLMGGMLRGRFGGYAACVCAAVISMGIVRSLCADDSATQPTTIPSTAPAADTTIQIPPDVQAIITDFSNDDFATRQQAQNKLVQMGTAVVPQLAQLLAGDLTEESRARINAAIRQIDENDLLGPSTITLNYKNAPLADILNDFAMQSRADLGLKRPEIVQLLNNRRASINLDHASFWDSLKEISRISSLHITQNGSARMQLENTGPSQETMFNALSVQKGAFMITPVSCTESRNVQYAQGGQSAVLNLQIVVVAEPKLHILESPNINWLKECTDDKGHALAVGENQNQYYVNENQHWIWQLNTQLKDVADLGSKISVLKGELRFTIATRTDVVEEDDMSKVANITKNINGLTVSIVKFAKENNQWQLTMQIPGQLDQSTWTRVQSIASSMEVIDDHGTAMQMQVQGENNNGVRTEVTMVCMSMNRPTADVVPKHFRWEIPVETRNVTVPFEMHDLDLPGGGGGL